MKDQRTESKDYWSQDPIGDRVDRKDRRRRVEGEVGLRLSKAAGTGNDKG